MGTVSFAASSADSAAAPVPPRAALLVVALGRTPRLVACLRALLSHTARASFEVVCVVNPGGPGDDDPATSAELASLGVPIIEPPVNLGWAGGLHHARARTSAELLVWVQDDMVVLPGWLDALVDAADAHPDLGALGSVQVDASGEVQLYTGGWCTDDLATWSATDDSAVRRPVGVEPRDWVTSKGLLVRAAAWDSIGGPDPSLYPLSYVDLDTCTHLRAHGWPVALVGEALILHEGNQAAPGMLRRYLAERLTPRVHERWSRVVPELPVGGAAAVEHPCTAERAADVDGWCAREALDIVVPFGRWAERTRRAEATTGEARTQELEARLAEIDAGFRTALGLLEAARAEPNALRATWSWRLTAPLRLLHRMVRG